MSVKRTVDRYEETKSIENRYKPGRPKMTSPRDIRNLIRLTKQNRRLSSSTLSKMWKLENGHKLKPSTVRKKLFENRMFYKPAVKKPRLLARHIKARKEFCKELLKWNNEKFRSVIWSDEMNIEVDCRKTRVMIRRMPNEKYRKDCIIERTKQGSGSIGVWACINYNGVGEVRIFKGRLNQHSYIDILRTNLQKSIDHLHENDNEIIFQQDNAPCHTAKSVQKWFSENKITPMRWPANSPDLNPIENLWSWLDSKISNDQVKNVNDLESSVLKHLKNVPIQIIQNLVDSMPRRIFECYKNKGGITSY
jgi:transposase